MTTTNTVETNETTGLEGLPTLTEIRDGMIIERYEICKDLKQVGLSLGVGVQTVREVLKSSGILIGRLNLATASVQHVATGKIFASGTEAANALLGTDNLSGIRAMIKTGDMILVTGE